MNQKGSINIILFVGFFIFIAVAGYFAVSQKSSLPTTPAPPVDESNQINKEIPKSTPPTKNQLFIKSLSPSSGNIGTSIKIEGSGFTVNHNIVGFGVDQSVYLNSPDGTSLTFIVPDAIDYCHPVENLCQEIKDIPVTAGIYEIYVINENGISNKLKFVVQDK